MSLLKTLKGTVVHFNTDKNFGFIKPDEPREDNRQLHFHLNAGCIPGEEITGELDLLIETRLSNKPKKGDRVVYFEANKPKGPVAFQWTYLYHWEEAERSIASRYPHYNDITRSNDSDDLIRVLIPYGLFPAEGHTKVVWEGYTRMFYHQYELGKLKHADNPLVRFQEKGLFRWKEREHPLNTVLGGSTSGVSDSEYERMERFYLAYLIENGMHLSGKLLAPVEYYAAIGRIGEVEGYEELWGMMVDYPESNPYF